MQRLVARAALAAAILLTANPSARAQDREIRASTQHAWGTFFGHTGAALGAGLATGVILAEPHDDDTVAIVAAVPMLSGTMSLLGWVAADEGWDPHLGWALAGLYPGVLAGAAIGLGAATLDAPGAQAAAFEGVAIGALSGGVFGALGLLAESLDGGRPGAVVGGFYGGFGTGLLAGMLPVVVSDGPEARAAPFLAAAAGSLLGVLVTLAIRAATD